MFTLFIEYRVEPEQLESYKNQLTKVREKLLQYKVVNYQVLEAVDQPYLFVEQLQLGEDLELYRSWKEALSKQEEAHPWQELWSTIVGGKEKFNMWAFKPI